MRYSDRETVLNYLGADDQAYIGSNYPRDITRLTKEFGEPDEIQGSWRAWRVPKDEVRITRVKRRNLTPEQRQAMGDRLRQTRAQGQGE